MALRAGRLNKRVAIQEYASTSDGGGGTTQTWATITNGTVWARVSPLDGVERFQAQQVQGTLTHEIEIRYRSDVTTKMRVSYDGRFFYISQPPINKDEKGESLVLICEERNV